MGRPLSCMCSCAVTTTSTTPPPTGACCAGNGTCVDYVSSSYCWGNLVGISWFENQLCANVSCPTTTTTTTTTTTAAPTTTTTNLPPVGYCCFNTSCLNALMTELECEVLGHLNLGLGSWFENYFVCVSSCTTTTTTPAPCVGNYVFIAQEYVFDFREGCDNDIYVNALKWRFLYSECNDGCSGDCYQEIDTDILDRRRCPPRVDQGDDLACFYSYSVGDRLNPIHPRCKIESDTDFYDCCEDPLTGENRTRLPCPSSVGELLYLPCRRTSHNDSSRTGGFRAICSDMCNGSFGWKRFDNCCRPLPGPGPTTDGMACDCTNVGESVYWNCFGTLFTTFLGHSVCTTTTTEGPTKTSSNAFRS